MVSQYQAVMSQQVGPEVLRGPDHTKSFKLGNPIVAFVWLQGTGNML